jgi:hypothetical protein
MSSISSVSSTSSLVNLMQMLTSAAPPAVASLLASKNVQAALAKASPTDIVQLSDQAMQLQMADGLFGGSSASSQTMTMADLFASILSPPSSSAGALSQMESSNLAQQSVLAAVYTPSGYATGSNSSSASGSLINLLA